MAELDQLHELASRAKTAETANARMALEGALSAIVSGRFLFQNHEAGRPAKPPGENPLFDLADSAQPKSAVQVPLGTTAVSQNPSLLPVVGFVTKTEDPTKLGAAFTTFLVENSTNPFCRPVFLVNDFRLLPFLGYIGCAYCTLPDPLGPAEMTHLKAKYAMSSAVDFISGEIFDIEQI